MAVIQLLVMNHDRRPEIDAINEDAKSETIPFASYEADLSSHTGFLPVKIGESESGFEYYFEPIDDGQLPTEATRFGSHQMIARTGGDIAEMCASLLFFRTAARLSGAAYVYPDGDIIVAPKDVDRYLSEQIEACFTDLRNEERKAEERAARQAKRAEERAAELASSPPPPEKPQGFFSRLFGKKD